MSVDTYFVHKALNDPSDAIEKIEYTIIGGSNKDLTRELSLLDESGKAHRATLVVDPDNVIQTIEINADGIGRKASFASQYKSNYKHPNYRPLWRYHRIYSSLGAYNHLMASE